MAVPSTTQREAVIVHVPSMDWAKELGALPTRPERQRRRSELMQSQEQRLRSHLSGLAVELERMEGVGSWTVRGARAVLDQLRGEDSPLHGSEFEVAPNDTFYAI